VEGQQVLERGPRQAGHAGERRRAVDAKARARERQIERGIGLGDGARGGVVDLLAELEILEETAGDGLAHGGCRSLSVPGPAPALRRPVLRLR
jgi:hypothetical protein